MDVVTLALAKKYTNDAIAGIGGGGITYKGAVDYYSDLPNNASVGDAYTVKYKGSSGTDPDSSEYVWGNYEGTNQWIKLGSDSSDIPVAINNTLGGIKLNGVETSNGFSLGVELDENDGAYVDTYSINTHEINANTISTDNINSTSATLGIGGNSSVTIGDSNGSIQIGYDSGMDFRTTTTFFGDVDFTNAIVTGIGGGGGVPVPSAEELVLMSGEDGTFGWTKPAKPIYLDDLSLGADPSTFDITGIGMKLQGSFINVNFPSYLSALSSSPSAIHYDVQLFAQVPYGNDTLTAGAVFHVESINTTQSGNNVTGDIIFKCSSLDQSGIITLINTMVPDKFPANTTDLLIKWSREFDETEQDYVETFEWVPVCNQSKVIIPLGLQSLQAFNNIITAFMTEAVPSKLGQFVFATTSDDFAERADIIDYLNAGKEVWIDLGTNFNNMKLLINKYTNGGFGFSLEVAHYTVTGVGDTYSSVNVEVYSNTIYAQGFVQVHST